MIRHCYLAILISLVYFSLVQGPQKVKYGDNIITGEDIIIATGSVPFVPKGIEVDGMCFFFTL